MHAHVDERGGPPVRGSPLPTSVQAIAVRVGQLLVEAEAALARGELVAVHVFHNRPLEGGQFEPTGRRLLPLDLAWYRQQAARAWPGPRLPELIDGRRPALQAFIREYLFVVLFQACAESMASENASRLSAMQREERNIEEILATLGARFHRLRQEQIDEELFDVIAGYQALTGAGAAAAPHAASSRGPRDPE